MASRMCTNLTVVYSTDMDHSRGATASALSSIFDPTLILRTMTNGAYLHRVMIRTRRPACGHGPRAARHSLCALPELPLSDFASLRPWSTSRVHGHSPCHAVASSPALQLTPRESAKLLVYVAADLARR